MTKNRHTSPHPAKIYFVALAKIGGPVLAIIGLSLIPGLGWLALVALLAVVAGVYWAKQRATMPVTILALATLPLVTAILWVALQHPAQPAVGVAFIVLTFAVPGAIGLLIPSRTK